MRKLLLLIVMLLGCGLWGCGGDDDGGGEPVDPVTPEDQAQANLIAGEAMAGLMEDMQDAMPEGPDPGAIGDLDVAAYAEDAQEALALDPGCANAHFLAAFLEFILMAQDEELAAWQAEASTVVGDVLGDLPGAPLREGSLLRDGIVGQSFRILHRAPLAVAPAALELRLGGADKDAQTPLVRTLQTIVRNRLLPATDRIVGHLGAVETHPDWSVVMIDESDTTEIDLGEVYVLDACVRALRAGLQVATAYDVEFQVDDSYLWLRNLMPVPGYTAYDLRPGTAAGDTLILVNDDGFAVSREEAALDAVAELLAPESAFLTLWTDPWSGQTAMQAGYVELNLLLSRLETAYEFIQAEGDDQDHDLISQMIIAELDAAILEAGADLPEWLGTWQTIPDVIAWVEDLLSGPYTVPLEDGDETFELTVDLSALFLEPVDDWKTKLPYHEFLPREEWATYVGETISAPVAQDPTVPYLVIIDGEEVELQNVGFVVYLDREWETTAPLVLLDGPQGEEIADGELPYFPDYTFGGLFPEMTRSRWQELLGEVPVL